MVRLVPIADFQLMPSVRFFSPLLMSEPIEAVQARAKAELEKAERELERHKRDNDNFIDFGA